MTAAIVLQLRQGRAELQVPLRVIEGPLMEGSPSCGRDPLSRGVVFALWTGMGIIGDLFGSGKMFVPQACGFASL